MMGGWGPGAGGGYGPGMMGGGMMGGGFGYGMLAQLNLSPEQWEKIGAIQEETSRKQWEVAGRMQDEAIKLRNMMFSEKRDRSALVNQYKKVQDLRQQQFQARLEVQDKIDAVLTKEQKSQIRRFGPWWAQEAVE
jgi:Spy/CpxP family protein refolding chaperone